MPIYEFQCNACGVRFDQLCRVNWEGAVRCPSCQSSDVRKLLSQFVSGGRSGGGCTGCSGKSCSTCK
ncbi:MULTISPECIES: FmdB family zinc ribbon protein [Sporomusaceae]|uniref:FmdB family zinc ribbon protein n=1 Tax=Sporomusaceae TaxID=1843490 RepID=UPI0009044DEA